MLELYIKSVAESSQQDSKESSEKKTKNLIVDAINDNLTSSKISSLQERRALEFLMLNNSSYDMSLALVICQLHQFKVNI